MKHSLFNKESAENDDHSADFQFIPSSGIFNFQQIHGRVGCFKFPANTRLMRTAVL